MEIRKRTKQPIYSLVFSKLVMESGIEPDWAVDIVSQKGCVRRRAMRRCESANALGDPRVLFEEMRRSDDKEGHRFRKTEGMETGRRRGDHEEAKQG
jgi:hypothetical protein